MTPKDDRAELKRAMREYMQAKAEHQKARKEYLAAKADYEAAAQLRREARQKLWEAMDSDEQDKDDPDDQTDPV